MYPSTPRPTIKSRTTELLCELGERHVAHPMEPFGCMPHLVECGSRSKHRLLGSRERAPAQRSRCRPQGRVTCHVSGVLGRFLGMVLRALGQVGLNALLLTLAESHEVIVPKPNLCKLTSCLSQRTVSMTTYYQ